MLRIACLTATLVLCGCTCNESDAPTQNGPGIAKRTPGAVPGARSGAAKKSGKAKTKPSGNKKKRTAAAPIGVAGDLQGVMTLKQEAGSAEGSVKTDASLELRWGTEKKVVALGNVPTPCEQQTPTPIGPESKELTPLWTVQCQGKKGSATLVILQQEALLQVRRSMTIEGGKASPYKLVKRIPLAEGAKIVRAEAFE
jgi:hypothetical protein